jgi:isocitrate dehydrogenase kinase/phosphatase
VSSSDYDELSSLTDVVSEAPERDVDEALSEDPWFPVGDRDVFPEGTAVS